MWGHVEKHRKQKPRKLRLLSSTKGKENMIQLQNRGNWNCGNQGMPVQTFDISLEWWYVIF